MNLWCEYGANNPHHGIDIIPKGSSWYVYAPVTGVVAEILWNHSVLGNCVIIHFDTDKSTTGYKIIYEKGKFTNTSGERIKARTSPEIRKDNIRPESEWLEHLEYTMYNAKCINNGYRWVRSLVSGNWFAVAEMFGYIE